ncbi:MAG TPA: long-chain fatty acid--CoA ligase [Burkholderiales bacterium]|jgi:fatty-acyl-CoA synthase|nr:long-chain fatty acid--CoA ligase [Burkholderiales bacterium]
MTFFDRHYPHWPPGVPKTLSVPRTSIYYNLEVSAARYPDRPAILYYGSALTYRDLKRDTLALAGHLQRRCGVRRGDRVLLYAQNSPQFIIGYYAILRANAVVVPVNPMNKSEELAHYIVDSDARTAIAGQELYREVEPHLVKDRIEHCVLACYGDYVRASTDLKVPEAVGAPRFDPARNGVMTWADVMAANLVPGAHEAGPDDLAVLPYTSGTTGLPKGCMLTHSNILATSTGACFWSTASSESVVLGVLPMFHLTGMQSNMNIPIQLGATSVLMTRWDRDTAAELIQRHRVTAVTGITTMIVDLLANPNLGKYDLSSIHRIGGGGASMPQAVAAQVERTFGQPFLEGYGLTETAAPSHANPVHRPKPQCGGIPYFDTDSRVINPETRRECGPNEVGEIITNGPQVFRGYWKQPQATEAAFIEYDGKPFFRTGDLGYYDEDGYFFITDRLKRMINASGFKVWPAEVEAMLYAHPDIQEACVIGTRDPHRGETVKAVVVLKSAARGRVQPDAIVAWAKDRMAAYKYPRVVELVDALPKTATGKIFWRKLQEDEAKRNAA